ncbi:Uncharacterised protein [Salmonella enterica subsp. enterica]|uniref:Uncharacterized protein n=1 Tax=Salmonella enterica I TaxID=59201 RepID=A0A379WN92_SALET|nr:Uncharacterised protein [Salmonella enterica subsp. enterica]
MASIPVKLRNSPRALFYTTLRIALFTDSQRRIDINLDKTIVADALFYQLPLGAVRRNKCRQNNQAASAIRLATSPTRRIFSWRSGIAKA